MNTRVSPIRQEIDSCRRDRTRQRLLVAAGRVIGERGESKANIDDFIRAAEVSRGTFYNYYSTKAELLDDLWQTVGRDPFQAIQKACLDVQDPPERIGTMVRLVLIYAQTNKVWGWLIYALSRDAQTVNSDLLSFPRPDLLAGRVTGKLLFTSIDSAADIVVGSVRRGLSAVLSEGRGAAYADELCLMVLCALGIDRAESARIVGLPLPLAEFPVR